MIQLSTLSGSSRIVRISVWRIVTPSDTLQTYAHGHVIGTQNQITDKQVQLQCELSSRFNIFRSVAQPKQFFCGWHTPVPIYSAKDGKQTYLNEFSELECSRSIDIVNTKHMMIEVHRFSFRKHLPVQLDKAWLVQLAVWTHLLHASYQNKPYYYYYYHYNVIIIIIVNLIIIIIINDKLTCRGISPKIFWLLQKLCHTQSVDNSWIPKCMTLNDLEWLFRVKFCFCAGLSGFQSHNLGIASDRHKLMVPHPATHCLL